MNLIISPTDFLYNGALFFKKADSGRCYQLVEPTGRYSKAARKGLLAHKQVSQAYYNECLEVCRRNITGGTG